MILLAMVFTMSLISPSAWAGNPQEYRWEGVAIGAGAAILGGALIHACIYPCPTPRVAYRYPCLPRYGYYHPPPRHHRGHWKAQKRWRSHHYKRTRHHGDYPGHGR